MFGKRKILFFAIIIIIILGTFITGFWFFYDKNLKQEKQDHLFMNDTANNVKKVRFITSDGVEIVGNYYPRKGDVMKRAVLFLHMMPATKESWDQLARELQKKDIVSLAIDLRGHGESVNIKNTNSEVNILDYQKFSDEEHQKSKLDIEAALEWLEKEIGLGPEHISVIGASIGANLALEALANYNFPNISVLGRAVALSPGLNYRGVKPLEAVRKLKDYQSVFYATAKDDIRNGGRSNTEEVMSLYDGTTAEKKIKIYEKGGHGTDMLNGTNLSELIINFLEN